MVGACVMKACSKGGGGWGGTHSMEQEADVALDQLNHTLNVQHRLLIPAAEVRPDLRLQVGELVGSAQEVGKGIFIIKAKKC